MLVSDWGLSGTTRLGHRVRYIAKSFDLLYMMELLPQTSMSVQKATEEAGDSLV